MTIDLLNPPECGVALPPVGAPNPLLPAVTAGFSRLIADTRRHRKYSQRRLARMAGVSQPWLASVERGKARMDLGLILRVLAALEVRVTLEVEEGRD